MFRFLIIAILAAQATACVTSKPFLYEVKGDETPGTVYLIGSMHALPDHEELTPVVVESLRRVNVG